METFKIDMLSGSGTPMSLWTDQWKCPLCQQVLSPSVVDFDTTAPLHNPMRCTGKTSGDRHVEMPCNPLPGANVYPYTLPDGLNYDMIIGRIPS